MKYIPLLLLAACIVSGCQSHPASTPNAYFEPAAPVPTSRPSPILPRHDRVNLSTNYQFSQSLIAFNNVTLSFLQLSLHNEGDRGDFILEILRVTYAEDIPPDDAPILARITLPHSSIPTTQEPANEPPQFITVSLAAFNIALKKGDVIVLRTRPTNDGKYSLGAVTGNVYQGRLFRRPKPFPNGDARWTSAGDEDLAFRIFTSQNPFPPEFPATQAATITPNRDTTPPGTLMAQSVWDPFRPDPSTSIPAFVRTPPLVCTAVAFESHGRYYLQLTAFNPTFIPRTISLPRPSITLTPEAGGPGALIDPRDAWGPQSATGADSAYLSSMANFNAGIGPNEGIIRTFPLGTLVDRFPPGKYRASIVLSPDITDKTVDAELNLPDRPHSPPKPATQPATQPEKK